jgi:hypothetical protein
MTPRKKVNIVKELKSFLTDLERYRDLRYLRATKGLTKKQLGETLELRDALLLKDGKLRPLIIDLTGKELIHQIGKGPEYSYNMWDMALRLKYNSRMVNALNICIDTIKRAIGRLEDNIAQGIRDQQGKPMGKSQSASTAETSKTPEEKVAAKELELILEGTPDMIIECITNFVRKLNSQGYSYKSIPRIGDSPDYTKWDKTYSARCAIFETHEGGEEQIGTIRLTLLPKEQTLLSVPEPEDWKSSFGVFLSYLVGEFKRLGFVHFEEEKPPMGFRLPHKEKDA